jgi:hypothetical protein
MAGWWGGLSALNRAFYVIAVFFSTVFGWQLISALSGLGGEEGGAEAEIGEDLDLEADGEGFAEDTGGLDVFRLLSVRSILAFGTLFTWAAALYLNQGGWAGWAIIRALLWGSAGMVVVTLFFWLLPRLTEEGTSDLDTAIGQTGKVYMNIPEGGVGRVRVVVSGALRFVPARSVDGRAMEAGTAVRIVGRLDASTLEVEEAEV